ncbi:MAG: hypothetical protein WBY75_12410, partial [Terracidiphilus sp.]
LAMDGDLWARFAVQDKPAHIRSVWSRMRFYDGQKNVSLRALSNTQDRAIRERLGVSYDNPAIVRARWIAAKALRTVWKAGTGCYSPSFPLWTSRPS